MGIGSLSVVGLAGRWLGRLRHPYLFALLLGLLAVDLLVIDPLPFFDEVLLAVASAFLAAWRTRRAAKTGQELKDATPRQ